MEGKNGERKGFFSLIMGLMKRNVRSTTRFLNGATFPIQSSEYPTILHKSLLSGGSLSPKLLEYIEVNQSGIRLKE
ncbi:hypothetical protein KBD33_00785 [Candidatus Gracilibacteria bacterium]|nr:hypothetical protein [Candidatus Gracilibacteria bacterium]